MVELVGPLALWPIPGVTSRADEERLAIIRDYGRRAGRERPPGSAFYSPAADSVIRPEALMIQWLPRAGAEMVSIVLADKNGRQVWRQDGVDNKAASLDPAGARSALLTYRANGGQGPLSLSLTDLDGNSTQVAFSLLSEAEAKTLDAELARWDQEAGLMRSLGRARAFARRGLLNDAAAEYDAALEESPESQELLRQAIAAHRATGNLPRVRDLTRRLRPAAKPPQ